MSFNLNLFYCRINCTLLQHEHETNMKQIIGTKWKHECLFGSPVISLISFNILSIVFFERVRPVNVVFKHIQSHRNVNKIVWHCNRKE